MAIGFLICCAGSGVFGWVLHALAERNEVARADLANYRAQQARARERTAWINDWADGVARGRTDVVIDLRDERGDL